VTGAASDRDSFHPGHAGRPDLRRHRSHRDDQLTFDLGKAGDPFYVRLPGQ
jgi:hypothetical protein